MRAVPPIVAPGRGLSLQTLARAGVTLVGRPIAVDGERVAFDGSVAANMAAGDAFAARIRTMVDELIRRQGLDTHPPNPPTPTRRWTWTRRPRSTCTPRRSPAWCGVPGSAATSPGLTPPWSTPDGHPRHQDGAAPTPGVWYLGLRWLIRRRSSVMFGFPDDAETVADAVRGHHRSTTMNRKSNRKYGCISPAEAATD
jgi:putative flavoprotein involved in K+ transport